MYTIIKVKTPFSESDTQAETVTGQSLEEGPSAGLREGGTVS